jgi:hypothetical protein
VRIYAEVHAAGHPADPGALKPWIAQLARRVAVDRLQLDARALPSEDGSTFELPGEPDLTEIELAMSRGASRAVW